MIYLLDTNGDTLLGFSRLVYFEVLLHNYKGSCRAVVKFNNSTNHISIYLICQFYDRWPKLSGGTQ